MVPLPLVWPTIQWDGNTRPNGFVMPSVRLLSYYLQDVFEDTEQLHITFFDVM